MDIRAKVVENVYNDTSMGGSIKDPEVEYYYFVSILEKDTAIGHINAHSKEEATELCRRINQEWTKEDVERNEKCFLDGADKERNRIVELIKRKIGVDKGLEIKDYYVMNIGEGIIRECLQELLSDIQEVK